MFSSFVETVADFHSHDPQIIWFDESFKKKRECEV